MYSNNFNNNTLYNTNQFRTGYVGLNNNLYNNLGYQTGRIDNYYGQNIIRDSYGLKSGQILGDGTIVNTYGTTVGRVGY
ncbi:MAG: hypothetical protein ABJI69_00915 [Balneola sp.]